MLPPPQNTVPYSLCFADINLFYFPVSQKITCIIFLLIIWLLTSNTFLETALLKVTNGGLMTSLVAFLQTLLPSASLMKTAPDFLLPQLLFYQLLLPSPLK